MTITERSSTQYCNRITQVPIQMRKYNTQGKDFTINWKNYRAEDLRTHNYKRIDQIIAIFLVLRPSVNDGFEIQTSTNRASH